MSATHNLHTAASLPPHVPPSAVLEALHDHNTALTLQALTQGHVKLPSTDPAILKDTYWYPTDLNPVTTYEVTECITFFPGVGQWGKKYIKFPSCFQDTPRGIRTRADASGVIVRAEFRVVKGGAGAEVEGENGGIGDAEWVLVEDVEVTCAWWMMPFVRGKMEDAHRGICRKVVEKVEMEMRQRAVAGVEFGGRHMVVRSDGSIGSVPKGKERLDKDLPDVPAHEDPAEVNASDTKQTATSGADLPEKITYR